MTHLRHLLPAVAFLALAGRALAQQPAASPPTSPPPATPATAPADAATLPAAAENVDENVVLPTRLLDRAPFDRITLNDANGNAVIETVLLDFPDRRVPDPFPATGTLELRQLSQPSVPYVLQWSAVRKIELYEQMLMAEGQRLTTEGKFDEAFQYLAFLKTNYPKLPGLEVTLQGYLWRDASTTFAAGNGEGAWPALLALYERNPEYPRLVSAVQAVSDGLIKQRLADKNYAAARAVVDLLEKHFPKLTLPNITQWRKKFSDDAQAQLGIARAALAERNFDAARAAAMFADAILPGAGEARDLLKQIQAAAPEMRVGVTEVGAPARTLATPTWAAARVAPLVNPRLVEMVDFGAEGGEYASRFGELTTSDSGVETSLRLSSAALHQNIRPDAVALQLAEAASPQNPDYLPDFAAAFQALHIAKGSEVDITWRRPRLHPEALLRTPMRQITTAAQSPGLWLDQLPETGEKNEARFQRTGAAGQSDGAPQVVIERVFDDDDAALASLQRGDIDAVDRVPPWQLEQISRAPGIVVAPYRLPTVHVLIPNWKNPLLEMREFRRALCYGTDRAGIIKDVLLGGKQVAGFVPLSGPFPAGVKLNDPAGYAYNQDLQPRPYDPRLAALLAGVARTTLAKRQEAERKERGETVEPPDPKVEPKTPPAVPLVLAYPADSLARVACQSLKLQLDSIGIPIKLVELPATDAGAEVEYDLLYAELTVSEPLLDARGVLSADGVAGRASALMATALERLNRAENWNEARARLQEIHRIAHYDLPVIPLWQTVNYFARRKWLDGVGDQPLTLYQNLNDWRKKFD